MSQINGGAKAIEKGTDNERHYDMDLIDILSEEVVGVFKSLIADKNLLRLVLAHAYAKECVRNHRNGTPSEDLAESQRIVEEMIVDCLYGSDPEYRDIFDEEDDEDDVDGMDKEEDSEDSFRSCVNRYIEHLKECCIYDEGLRCIGCGLCDHDPILRLLVEYLDDDLDDDPDLLGSDDAYHDDEDSDDCFDDDPDTSCNGCRGASCHGCRVNNPDEEDTIPKFEVVEGHLTITFVGRDWDA